jgi:hypothetical protein
MFDEYEPTPAIRCSACGGEVRDWQGKDGPCLLLIWRQGVAAPLGQRSDPEWHVAIEHLRLPAEFAIGGSCRCGRHNEAFCQSVDGTWARTVPLGPVYPERGKHGRWSCPCCGCFTLREKPPGTFEICPVCDWEDDPAQFEDPTLDGAANAESLAVARSNHLAGTPARPSRTRPPQPDELE